jgi:GH24 family phage-related lysozyme (muramidase)
VDLIKSCEGFSAKAYWDYKQWTIGYGTYVASDTTYPNGITEAQAEQLLYNVLGTYEDYVNAFLKRNSVVVNQDQFDALVCFTYAIPSWSFKGNEDYTLAQMLINGYTNYTDEQVYDIFGLYVKAGSGANKVTLPGLVRRRVMEASLFLYGDTTHDVPESVSTTTEEVTVTTTVPATTEAPVATTTTATNTVATATTTSTTTNSVDTTTTTITKSVSDSSESTANASSSSDGCDVEPTTWMVSDKDGVNLRHTYGIKADKLGAIPYNATVTVSETVQADGYTWGKVTYNGITGWCALDYCTQLYDVDVKCDINGDGYFLITDVCMLKAYLYNGLELTDEQLKEADYNGDGKVNVTDYQLALKSILLD